MKTIKTLLLLLTITLSAQAQMKIGLKAGMNASSIIGMEELTLRLSEYDARYQPATTSYRPAWHAGLILQTPLDVMERYFFQAELLCSVEGLRLKEGEQSGVTSLSYLKIPAYFGYNPEVGPGLKLLLGVGPYLAMGFMDGGHEFSSTFKRYDIGASAMLGIQYGNYQLSVGYDHGLIDMTKSDDWIKIKEDYNLKNISNRNFKVSIAYFFQ